MGTVSLAVNGVPVRLIHCYHTPGLRASLYSLHRHHRSPRCAFVGDQLGIYLTFGRMYTRVQDDIDFQIQLRPLPQHPNLKYTIRHTLEPVLSITANPSAGSSNTPTQRIPPPLHLPTLSSITA
jgi:hypothetical protein